MAVNSNGHNGMTSFSNPYSVAWDGSRFVAVGIFIFDDRG